MSEKTEKATRHKLKKAKEQGQVNKSIELNTCIFMLVILFVGLALWPLSAVSIKQLIMDLFYLNAHMPHSIDQINKFYNS